MVRSGLMIGILTLVLVLGSTTLFTPFCAPCLGLVLGIAAGYMAGSNEKPVNSNEAIRKGAIAGAIAGGLGFAGGMVGAVINGAVVNPEDLTSIYQLLRLPNPNYDQASIWMLQLTSGLCVGLFNTIWMAILGLAGGALWFQLRGKDRGGMIVPPQNPITPAR